VRLGEPEVAAPLASQNPTHRQVQEALSSLPDVPRGKWTGRERDDSGVQASNLTRALVAALLIAVFAGMLLATRYYFQSRWGTRNNQPQVSRTTDVGREGTIIQSDVRLRPDPGTDNSPVGVAELGSRVRVLSVSNNWREIEVLEHGHPKDDPAAADRGWVHQRFLKLD
jgi:hypothetical protein